MYTYGLSRTEVDMLYKLILWEQYFLECFKIINYPRTNYPAHLDKYFSDRLNIILILIIIKQFKQCLNFCMEGVVWIRNTQLLSKDKMSTSCHGHGKSHTSKNALSTVRPYFLSR